MPNYTESIINFIFGWNSKKIEKSIDKVDTMWSSMETSVTSTGKSIDSMNESSQKGLKKTGKVLTKIENQMDTIDTVGTNVSTMWSGMKTSVLSTGKSIDSMNASSQKGLKETKKALTKVENQLNQVGSAAIDSLNDIKENTKGLKMIAVAQVFEKLKGHLQETRGAAESALSPANNQAESFIDNLYQVNRVLNLNREDLRKFRKDVTDVPSDMKRSFDMTDLGESMEGLINSGMKNLKMIKEMSPLVAMLKNATGETADTMAKDVYMWGDRWKLPKKNILDVMATMHKMAQKNAIDFSVMRGDLEAYQEDFSMAFKDMTTAQKVATMKGFSGMRAAFSENWAGIEPVIKLMSGTLADVHSEEAGQLQAITGMAARHMQNLIKTGNIDVIMNKVLQRIQEAGKAGNASLKGWADSVGLPKDSLGDLYREMGSINKRMKGYAKGLYNTADAHKYLKGVIENSTTGAEKWRRSITFLAAKEIPILNTSLMDIWEVVKDIPWLQLVAAYYVLGPAIKVLSSSFMLLSGTMGAATGMTGALTFAWNGLAASFYLFLATGPGLIIAAIAVALLAIGGAVAYILYKAGELGTYWEKFKAIVMDALSPLMEAFNDITDLLSDVMKMFGLTAGKGGMLLMVAKALADVFLMNMKVIGFFVKIMAYMVKFIVGVVIVAVKLAIWQLKVLGKIFSWLGEAVYDEFAEPIGKAVKFIKNVWGGLMIELKLTKELFTDMGKWVLGIFDKIIEGINDANKIIIKAITGLIDVLGLKGAADKISGVFKTMFAALQTPIKILKEFINKNIIDPLNSILSYDLPVIGPLSSYKGMPDKIPKFATGMGYVDRPTVALIGEAGPEFILKENQLIAPIMKALKVESVNDQAILIPQTKAATKIEMTGVERKLDALILLFRENLYVSKRNGSVKQKDPTLNNIVNFGE